MRRIATFLLGAVTGAIIRPFLGLIFRDAAKATIKAGLHLKKLAAEAVEDLELEDQATEVDADGAAQAPNRSSGIRMSDAVKT